MSNDEAGRHDDCTEAHNCGEHPQWPAKGPFVTKTGRILTDEDIQALADEAERGYEI